jgi:hypothetical protein
MFDQTYRLVLRRGDLLQKVGNALALRQLEAHRLEEWQHLQRKPRCDEGMQILACTATVFRAFMMQLLTASLHSCCNSHPRVVRGTQRCPLTAAEHRQRGHTPAELRWQDRWLLLLEAASQSSQVQAGTEVFAHENHEPPELAEVTPAKLKHPADGRNSAGCSQFDTLCWSPAL